MEAIKERKKRHFLWLYLIEFLAAFVLFLPYAYEWAEAKGTLANKLANVCVVVSLTSILILLTT
jgi:hypothetical protein